MPKKFWIKCIKTFFRLILSIGGILGFIIFFSTSFGNFLESLGFIGLILTCILCVFITLLLELTGIMKLIEDLEGEDVEKKYSDNKFIYFFYKIHKKNKKRYKAIEHLKTTNEKEEFSFTEISYDKFHYYNLVEFLNIQTYPYYLPDFPLNFCDIDIIQEAFHIILKYAVTNLFISLKTKIKFELPETAICSNIEDMKSLIKNDDWQYAICNFEGIVEGLFMGSFIIGFNQNTLDYMEKFLRYKYSSYISNYQIMMLSFVKEISSIIGLSGLSAMSILIFTTILEQQYASVIEMKEIFINNNLSHLNYDTGVIAVKVIGKKINSHCNFHLHLLLNLETAKKMTNIFSKKVNMDSYLTSHKPLQ